MQNIVYSEKSKNINLQGISTGLTTSQKENYEIIRKNWISFNSKLKNFDIKLGKNWEKYGITYKINDKYYYMSAIPNNSENRNNDFEQFEIQKGLFAHFYHYGSMDSIKDTYLEIYKIIIPENNIKLNRTNNLLHFEYYNNQFNWNSGASIINIFVPVFFS